MHHVEELTLTSALLSWKFALWWNLLIVLLGAAYAAGVVRLRRERPERSWPAHRSWLFASGLVSLFVAMNSFVAVYSHALFTMHMVQHLMLIMLVPALLVYGKPLRLWSELDGSGRVERVLRGRTVGILTHPAWTMVLYSVVLVATHLTPFMQVMLLNPWLHHAESVLYLVTGYLTFLPLLGREPTRWQRFPYPLRVFSSLMGMGPDTGIGVILMMADDPLFPAYGMMRDWWIDDGTLTVLADQRLGGGIMWFFGDALMAVFALVLVKQWMRAKGSEAGFGNWLESARRSALAETDSEAESAVRNLRAAEDVDEDERARQAYNAMLARLARQDGEHRRSGR
ncbi:putative copper resistance protein D [Actinopolyspora xinjiangensis]|uniref:Putative copper resistance protein D n=1 Tax=Actinopolyspora xinjiangensis TaxID=405564 RepID=A0A1H0P0S2_9ACTN|nr:cytochrome c oxidase assembly protein [Actinopolyspora xinjiangensis]SDO98305.1 putative copper resistance protein D [Actinopolyspora xinjiangensis]